MVTALFRPHPQPLRDLCAALDVEDLSADPRFATAQALAVNAAAFRGRLDPVFATRTSDEWVSRLEARDVLCAPIRRTAEALDDPQLEVNGLIVEVEHPRLGRMRHVGTPLRLAGTPPPPPRPAPTIGQHTDEILREAGFAAAEIAGLRERRVVA
jgi:formyl-CoA transferase